MHFHELRFHSSAGLARALRSLMDCPHVEDCIVNGDGLRVRFTAPAEQAAELMSRLHRRGDLSDWHFRRPTLAS